MSKDNSGRYADLYIFVPSAKQIIHIAERGGGNLLIKGTGNEYVDYLYFEQYELNNGITAIDGGTITLRDVIRYKYCCTTDTIRDVLEALYGNREMEYEILEQREADHEDN